MNYKIVLWKTGGNNAQILIEQRSEVGLSIASVDVPIWGRKGENQGEEENTIWVSSNWAEITCNIWLITPWIYSPIPIFSSCSPSWLIGKCPVRSMRRRTPKCIQFLNSTSASRAASTLIINYRTKIRVASCAERSKLDVGDAQILVHLLSRLLEHRHIDRGH
jgi:hypothetical protein